MRVLIQSKAGQPYNLSATIAAYGFAQRGYDLVPFRSDEIDRLHFAKEDVVVGGVGTYRRVFKKLDVHWEGHSYPASLTAFLGRKIQSLSLKDLANILESRSLFIKPAFDNKSFPGFVCGDRWDPRLAGLEEDTTLIGSEIVNFKSEFRVYVLEGKIQNICRYRGSADHFPNARLVREMIATYEVAPMAYSLDVGLDEKGQTLLVEVNEGLALGNYGLAPSLHAKMIAARWHELMGNQTKANEEAQTIDSPAYLNEA